MDMKEAIEVLNCMQAHFCNNQKSMENINEIIKLLQKDEKFKSILKDFENEFVYEADFKFGQPVYNQCTIGYLLDKFKEKLVKKTITIEIEAKDKNIIKWAEHQIKDLENNVWNHQLKVKFKEGN